MVAQVAPRRFDRRFRDRFEALFQILILSFLIVVQPKEARSLQA